MLYIMKENDELVIKNEETDEVFKIEKFGKNKKGTYDWILPKIEGHNIQKYINQDKLEKYLSENDKYELVEKDAVISSGTKSKSSGTKSSTWNWLDFVKDDEKEIVQKYNQLKDECIKRHDEMINDPKYQLKMKKAKLMKMLEELDKELGE